MKKMRFSIFFILFFFLVLTPTAMAVKPIGSNVNTGQGLQISIPFFEHIKVDSELTFNFHVFNISNGKALSNDTLTCEFSLYNPIGKLLMQLEDPINFEDNHYAVTPNSNNFSQTGEYGYVFLCNSTEDLGGFIEVGVDATADGLPFQSFHPMIIGILTGFALCISGLALRRRIVKVIGGALLMVVGVLTISPGFNFVTGDTLAGVAIATLSIAFGFLMVIEDGFAQIFEGGVS